MIMSISDEHLLLTSRITEGKRKTRTEKKKRRAETQNLQNLTQNDFQPLHNQC